MICMEADYMEDSKEGGTLVFEDGSTCSYRIVRSDRRTMALQVTKEGEVVVRIPRRLPYGRGHELAQKNKSWIFAHRGKLQTALKRKEGFHWTEGAALLLFGQIRTLHIESDFNQKRFQVQVKEEKVVLTGPVDLSGKDEAEGIVKDVLKQFYRQKARGYLEEKTALWAARMQLDYGRISIRDQATRWGSCSTKGNLNFNWRLVLLPAELADYVVVHELAHRIHMNHSPAFWAEVEKELPDYRLKRRSLKSYEDEIYQKY